MSSATASTTTNGYNINQFDNEWYVEKAPQSMRFKWKADAIAYANSLPTLYAFMLPSGVCLYLTEDQAKSHPKAKHFC